MYRKYHLNILFLLLLMNIQVGGCGNSSNSENTPGPSSASLWVDITNQNEGQTAKQLCASLGFTKATSARRCPNAGGLVISISDPYSSPVCPDATTYAECYKFYPCDSTTTDGVIWEAVYCEI